MITWSLWLVLVWWIALILAQLNEDIKRNEPKIPQVNELMFMVLLIPAPFVLLDYLLGLW